MAKKHRAAAAPARPKTLVLERQPDESLAEWEQALADIVRGGAATVTRQPDGSALIQWPAGASL